jgi:REP element-mobilizing transposase RayT
MAKFKNKYRIESTRLQNWDYAQAAVYFITICTANRDHFFGMVKNNEMVYSDIGAIVAQEWVKTPEIRPDMNLELGEFMVMPNHFHGVIFIGNNQFNGNDNIYKNEFGPQSKNLSSIIRGFKSAVTVQAKKINPNFGWQARFHDHIIRNPKSYDTISQYIIDNPKKWGEDEFHK